MWSLLKKELSSSFSNLTGYLVIIVFLSLNGLFLWVIPTPYNILEYPYASLETLFTLSPWVFLFLVPALTMQLFAEEKRTGTLELLLTKPLSHTQIVLAKYLASVILVLIAILPSFIYLISIYQLADPVGNVDMGATLGSYIGLLFLGAIYCAIGIFSSAINSTQVSAFITALLLCLFCYLGIEYLSSLFASQELQISLIKLGINEHYLSISRGVIDSRDLWYFLAVILLFLYGSKLSLDRSIR